MHKKFPEDYTYMPETYSYPKEKSIILQKFRSYKLSKDNLWLVKPKKTSLGISNVVNISLLTTIYESFKNSSSPSNKKISPKQSPSLYLITVSLL